MHRAIFLSIIGVLFSLSFSAHAWQSETHRRIVADALTYMNSSRATPEQRQAYDFYIQAAGSFEQAAEQIGQATVDVDFFDDTHLGNLLFGYEFAPLGSLLGSFITYTTYWHFINLTRGEDAHGNAHGGYDFRFHTPSNGGFFDRIDEIAAFYLYNADLQQEDFDTTESDYRLGSFSNRQEHYAEFQNMAFQPIDHLGKFWFDQFKQDPSLETIGYALHAIGDSSQPHHVWIASGSLHAQWEGWVDNFYFDENLNDPAAVAVALEDYNTQQDIQEVVLFTAEVAYEFPEVLVDQSQETRRTVARVVIPLAIAATVTILTSGANHFIESDE